LYSFRLCFWCSSFVETTPELSINPRLREEVFKSRHFWVLVPEVANDSIVSEFKWFVAVLLRSEIEINHKFREIQDFRRRERIASKLLYYYCLFVGLSFGPLLRHQHWIGNHYFLYFWTSCLKSNDKHLNDWELHRSRCHSI